MNSELPRLLCVDDEPNVLEGLSRNLGLRFEVDTASSGAGGLEKLDAATYDVVISDMRMPHMDGATFLTRAKEKAPDTERILLTGQADLKATVAAINGGAVFRFLNKPCPQDLLERTVLEAVERRKAVLEERSLQQATLAATVKVLLQILSMAAPVAFRRASFFATCARHVTTKLRWPNPWQYEVAAELSQLGQVAIPDSVLERSHAKMELTSEEKAMIAGQAETAFTLLHGIPRLQVVANIVRYQGGLPLNAKVTPEEVRGVRLLQVIGQLDRLLTEQNKLQLAIPKLRAHYAPEYQEIVQALADVQAIGAADEPRAVRVADLKPGMIVEDDVRAKSGLLLLARGQEVNSVVVERLSRFATVVGVREPIHVRFANG